jgi:hypothetical protein
MVRRFLCLATLLLVIGGSVPACDNKAKTSTQPVATDPDKVSPPRSGGKGG